MADHLDPTTPARTGSERRRSRNPLKTMMQHLSVESAEDDGSTSPRRESLIRRLSRRGSRSPSAHSVASDRSKPGATDPALCRACASWAADIDAGFDEADDFCAQPVNPSADVLEKREQTLMQLVGVEGKAATCPLCRLFWTMRVESEGEGDYYLTGFSSRDSSYLMNSAKMIALGHPAKGRDRGFSPAYLGVVPKKKGQDALEWDVKPEWFRGTGMLFRTEPDPVSMLDRPKTSQGKRSRDPSPSPIVPWKSTGIWGREIGQSIDMSVARGWLNYCRSCHQNPKTHQGRCARRRISGEMQGFRLIDCTQSPPKVINASLGEDFAALSYPGGSHTAETLLRIVRDAVTVTQDLGLRYLWVDRVCLDGSRPDDKLAQVLRMNEIYEGAEVTIIAACGGDGLPGVGSTPRPQQPKYRFTNTDVTLVSSLRDPRFSIKESVWYTRGWTYQEGLLSRRRLVFTDEQMYWECDGMSCPETLVLPLDLYHDKEQQRMCDFMHPGLFNGVSFGDGGSDVWRPLPTEEPSTMSIFREADQHIVNYTQRDLTYHEDSLNAYLGISQRLDNSLSRGKLLSLVGIPLWAPMDDPAARTTALFALSMSFWHHKHGQDVRRRPHMPSWTWVGWSGSVELFSSIVMVDPEARPKRKVLNQHYVVATQLTRNEKQSRKWTYVPDMALLQDGMVVHDFPGENVLPPDVAPLPYRPLPSFAPAKYGLQVSNPLVLDKVRARAHAGGWMFNDVSVDVRLNARETAADIRKYIPAHGTAQQMTVLWLVTVLWSGEEPKEVMAMLLVVEQTGRGTWERVGRMRMGFAEEAKVVLRRCEEERERERAEREAYGEVLDKRVLDKLLERLPLRRLEGSIVVE